MARQTLSYSHSSGIAALAWVCHIPRPAVTAHAVTAKAAASVNHWLCSPETGVLPPPISRALPGWGQEVSREGVPFKPKMRILQPELTRQKSDSLMIGPLRVHAE